MSKKTAIESKNAPKAIGPYSQAIVVGEYVYLSGQLGLDPKTNEFVGDDVLSQAKQVFLNIKALLEAAGSDLEHVIKVEIFLTDMNSFPAINELYGQIFVNNNPPVRQTIEVSALPKWAKIMMSCQAILKSGDTNVFYPDIAGKKLAEDFR